MVEAIVRVVEEEGIEYLYLGTRGMGGVKKFFLGSISDGVARKAPCSVHLIKEKDPVANPPEKE